MKRIVVRLSEPYGAPQVIDVKGLSNEALRFGVWDSLSAGLVYDWVDSRAVPVVDWSQVVLPAGIKRQDIRLLTTS
jgi:hypothetical protein